MRTNERATSLMPPSTSKCYSAFRQNLIFLKDQNMKKYQHYNDVGEKFYQLQAAH